MQTVADLYAQATAAMEAGQYERAASLVDAVLVHEPRFSEAVSLAGIVAAKRNQMGVAIALLHHAVDLLPDNAVVWSNFGLALSRANHTEPARQAFQQALKLQADHPLALAALAGTYVNDGNPMPGVALGQKALRLSPNDTQAIHNVALCLLELGRWSEAWELWRRRDLPGHKPRNYPGAEWDGQPVDWLVIHGEQGLGDEVMFLGCLPDLIDRGRKGVVIEVERRLVPVVSASFPLCTVIGGEGEFKHPGEGSIAWTRIGDLPRHRDEPTPPKRSGYLVPTAWVSGYEDAMLFALSGGTMDTHALRRNPPMAEWKRVAEAARARGWRPVSIQYGPDGPAQAAAVGIEHDAEAAGNIERQANVIAAAGGGLLSVQQTALHLGGALGARVQCVLSNKPAWRYGLTGPMPWYQTVSLHRMTPHETEWRPVMTRLIEALPVRAAKVAA